MKIRSVTYFDNPGQPLQEDFLLRAEKFLRESQASYQDGGIEVQSTRFASAPFPTYLGGLPSHQIIDYAIKLEDSLTKQGFSYLSLGPALPSFPASYSLIPDLIEASRVTFYSGCMTHKTGLSLISVRACAEIIQQLTPLDPNGFANLYFAALGNVPSGAPFFPAAYHSGGPPAFSIALEGADLGSNQSPEHHATDPTAR